MDANVGSFQFQIRLRDYVVGTEDSIKKVPKLTFILAFPTLKNMNHLSATTEDLLELAANNDVDGFRKLADQNPSIVDDVGMWYGRRKGSKQMVLENRTPLMVAATYGNVDVVRLILSLNEIDVNQSCGKDKSTALHCAASGGSTSAVEIVTMLLAAGANPNSSDASGQRPIEVIVVSPKFEEVKLSLERLLNPDALGKNTLRVSTANSLPNSPPLSPSPVNGSSSSGSDSTTSPKNHDLPVSSAMEKKEYPVDPSFPDIKNGIYSTDEFRMFSFKVRPCSRAYSHDWTECPFVHPGENARRRDPRKYHYSCVPCPDFRKGACRRGDMCEYAHGVFECWLHPAQYRTRICKDGVSCNRRVCFFAHTQEELRPLYVSTGSAVPSPRSATSIDYATSMNLLPGSPSSVSIMSPSPYSPPMSPSASNITNMGWNQPNVPALYLSGSSLHSSRLRSSLNARDMHNADFRSSPDIDIQQPQHFVDEISQLGQTNMNSYSLNVAAARSNNALAPSNLEDLFAMESSSSPRYFDQPSGSGAFTTGHKPAALINPSKQQQMTLSPIKTSFTPKNYDHPLLQASFGVPSSGRMSPRSMEPISPVSSRASMLAHREKQLQQFRSLSSRDLLGSSSTGLLGSPRESWTNWGSSSHNQEWDSTSDIGTLRRSSSFENGDNGEEPDLSWVQKLVRETAFDMNDDNDMGLPAAAGFSASLGEGSSLNRLNDQLDPATLSALLDQMHKF